MPNHLGRFAINADDVTRARRFYERTFAWTFMPWGPPNFYLIETGTPDERAVGGLLQERRELVKGARMVGYECTLTVSRIDETIKAITANGGTMATPKFDIPTVGTCAYFNDTEGNVAGIIQPHP
jgi:predicted enzyme related to lactoylglutathione lyase